MGSSLETQTSVQHKCWVMKKESLRMCVNIWHRSKKRLRKCWTAGWLWPDWSFKGNNGAGSPLSEDLLRQTVQQFHRPTAHNIIKGAWPSTPSDINTDTSERPWSVNTGRHRSVRKLRPLLRAAHVTLRPVKMWRPLTRVDPAAGDRTSCRHRSGSALLFVPRLKRLSRPGSCRGQSARRQKPQLYRDSFRFLSIKTRKPQNREEEVGATMDACLEINTFGPKLNSLLSLTRL